MINFDEVPYEYYKPGTYIEAAANYDRAGLVAYPARALLMVQKLASGTAQALQLYRITRPEQGAALFGVGSVGDDMVRAWKKANKTTDVYAIAQGDDAAGVAATGTFTFTGAGAGVVPLYIGNVRIPVKITTGMTVTQMATAAVSAIALRAGLPVTASSAAGVVTLTARHKGEVGNHISHAVARRIDDSMPTGIAVAVGAMANGATNPDVQDILDAIAAERFTDVVVPWDDSGTLDALADDFAARFTAMGRKDGGVFVGHRGTFGALTTKCAITNSPHITPIGADGMIEPPWVWASALGGVAAFQLTNDPARQLRSLVLPGITAPPSAALFTEDEQNLLLQGGCSTFNALDDGAVTLDRVVTTYKMSPLGITDHAWMDIMVPRVLTRIRYDWSAWTSLTYPRSKLADDDSIAASQDTDGVIVTPKRMLGSWGARCRLYAARGWIENISDTLARSRFERDDTDRNRLNGKQPITIMGNLMILAGRLEFDA
ncbi:phage tail sheath subtilisin-like domain-containing protein [Xanthobacter autotrophicus]|uniref:phage tail sheath subtilisin-like domain-containing protein n=1 Tax=Xanthobacter TaxID=279 RepID=UPI0024AB85CC|nr:phage tail sheath subtilisin-like domain-containing protein [Xanthobacter autotrophicus]MDI4664715.1 phage tail sheath subtilisin-like domain-containing protein [Xanthobacter autotrophicus]